MRHLGSHARIIGRFCSLLAFALTCGCSSSPSEPQKLSTSDINFDERSGLVSHIVIPTESNLGNSDFVVATDGGISSYWNPTPTKRDGQSVLSLSPIVLDHLPSTGDRFVVKAIDRTSGAERAVASLKVDKANGDLLDGNYVVWRSAGTVRVPGGWQQYREGAGAGALEPISTPAGSGVAVNMSSLTPSIWNVLYYWQDVGLYVFPRTVYIKSDRDCDADQALPHSISGITVTDRRGYELSYCVSSRARSKAILQLAGGRQTVVMTPGRINRWVPVVIDPPRMMGFIRLIPDEKGMVQLRAGIAYFPKSESVDNQAVSIAFSGFNGTR